MKKVLILGAGIYQVPLIETAKKLGYETIVCSIKGDYPGFKLADKIYYVDTRDSKEILKISIDENISGICTTGTDVAIRTVGFVCDKLGLKGLSEEAGQKATDKAKMKKAFFENNVNTAKFVKVRTLEEAYDAYRQLNTRSVLKVTDQSGSRGIKMIDSEPMLEKYFNEVLSSSNKDYLLLEEYVRGHEIGIDAFIENGKVLFIAPHDKITYNYNGIGIPIGHIFPYKNSEEVLNNIEEQTLRAVQALQLDNCAVNIDAFITPEGEVSIIEAGGRAGATGIPELISLLYDCNYYEIIIKNCLGEEIHKVQSNPVFCASRLIISEVSGIFKKVNIERKKEISVKMDVTKGDYVQKFVNGTCRIGQAIIQTSKNEMLGDILDSFDQYVSIEIEVENE